MFLNVIHQEANHEQADNKGCHTSYQENSHLSTCQGIPVNEILNRLKATVTKHGWNTKEEGEVSSYATTRTNDDTPRIVAPERLVPGMILNTWKRPI